PRARAADVAGVLAGSRGAAARPGPGTLTGSWSRRRDRREPSLLPQLLPPTETLPGGVAGIAVGFTLPGPPPGPAPTGRPAAPARDPPRWFAGRPPPTRAGQSPSAAGRWPRPSAPARARRSPHTTPDGAAASRWHRSDCSPAIAWSAPGHNTG